jgi:MtN3 and saliva related transmembrane protein
VSILFISGAIAFITSFVGLLPQIFKTLKTKSSQDLSMLMLVNYFICSMAWIVYGGTTGSMVVLASNVLGLIVSIALILLKMKYDARIN